MHTVWSELLSFVDISQWSALLWDFVDTEWSELSCFSATLKICWITVTHSPILPIDKVLPKKYVFFVWYEHWTHHFIYNFFYCPNNSFSLTREIRLPQLLIYGLYFFSLAYSYLCWKNSFNKVIKSTDFTLSLLLFLSHHRFVSMNVGTESYKIDSLYGNELQFFELHSVRSFIVGTL